MFSSYFFFEDDHGFGDSSYLTLPSRVEWIIHAKSSWLLKKASGRCFFLHPGKFTIMNPNSYRALVGR